MCRNVDPWFLPALVAVWGPTLLTVYRGPAVLPAREVAHALAEAWEEQEDFRASSSAVSGAGEAAPPLTCPPTPCPAGPPEPECTFKRAASRFTLELPDFGWIGVVLAVLSIRGLEGVFLALWRSCRRDGNQRRGLPVPSIAHY